MAALLLLGMAIARSAAAPLTAARHPLTMLLAAITVTVVGFLSFW